MHAIKRNTTVDANHEIRVSVPELPEGYQAEVIVLFKDSSGLAAEENFVALLGKHPRFKSMDEVVAHVRELREDRE